MDAFWKAAAVMILVVILGTALGKTEKDIAVVLSVAACCMAAMAALTYLSDVIAFLWEIGNGLEHGTPFLRTLLKIAGVALTTELTGLIGADAGSSSLGKAMQILGNAAILFLALPLLETFLSMVQDMMGRL